MRIEKVGTAQHIDGFNISVLKLDFTSLPTAWDIYVQADFNTHTRDKTRQVAVTEMLEAWADSNFQQSIHFKISKRPSGCIVFSFHIEAEYQFMLAEIPKLLMIHKLSWTG